MIYTVYTSAVKGIAPGFPRLVVLADEPSITKLRLCHATPPRTCTERQLCDPVTQARGALPARHQSRRKRGSSVPANDAIASRVSFSPMTFRGAISIPGYASGTETATERASPNLRDSAPAG